METAVVESVVEGDDFTACIGHVGKSQRDIAIPILVFDETSLFPDSIGMILIYDFPVAGRVAIALPASQPMTEPQKFQEGQHQLAADIPGDKSTGLGLDGWQYILKRMDSGHDVSCTILSPYGKIN